MVALAGTLIAVAGCAGPETTQAGDPTPASSAMKPEQAPEPRRGAVTDVVAFEAFIATTPTPAAFRQAYPDVVLILPGDIATREFRSDRSRYFAELDGAGRIVGGSFQ